jgi:hypothetical protein
MKLSIEVNVKDENKITTYTMDLSKAGAIASGVKNSVEGFLKDTFKKETFVKEEK